VPNRINDTSKTSPLIVSTSKTQRTIDPAEVAKALGAEEIPAAKRAPGGSPVSVFAVRQELFQRLRSTGGRPSLEGAGERKKIPLVEGDWEQLEKVARAVKMEGMQPTPAQVASILIHRGLQELNKEMEYTSRKRK
jgi:hypothetical protein